MASSASCCAGVRVEIRSSRPWPSSALMPLSFANRRASSVKVEVAGVGSTLLLVRSQHAVELAHFLDAHGLAEPVLALNQAGLREQARAQQLQTGAIRCPRKLARSRRWRAAACRGAPGTPILRLRFPGGTRKPSCRCRRESARFAGLNPDRAQAEARHTPPTGQSRRERRTARTCADPCSPLASPGCGPAKEKAPAEERPCPEVLWPCQGPRREGSFLAPRSCFFRICSSTHSD